MVCLMKGSGKNWQSIFLIIWSSRFLMKGTYIFVPVAESDGSNRNMDGLSEWEKMEIDPYYAD